MEHLFLALLEQHYERVQREKRQAELNGGTAPLIGYWEGRVDSIALLRADFNLARAGGGNV